MYFSPNWHSVWLVVASFLAGALNAVAGGGSFLSFPAMLAVGVAPIQANATNTVALWPGQVTSAVALRRELMQNLRLLLPVGAASLIGGTIGALVLLHTGQATFMHLVPWLLLVASLLFWSSGPLSRRLQQRALLAESQGQAPRKPSRMLLFLALLVVAFYIGYFGAGSGFLIMSVVAFFGVEDMHEINALKVVGAGLANGVAVITFIVRGAIVWKYCVVAMVLAGIGGYMGAGFSRGVNPKVLRLLVVVIGCSMAAYFFWRQV